MIVDCAVYQKGQRVGGELTLTEAYEASRQDSAFVWLGLLEPTTEEFESVRREFDLHELAIEDAVHAHQRPKMEVYGDTIFVVLKTARYAEVQERVEFGEIMLFVGDRFIISVRHGEASSLGGVRAQSEAKPELLGHGPGWVMHAIVDRVVDDYEPVLAGLENDIDEVEVQVFAGAQNPAERIYKLIGEVLELHHATGPLVHVLGQLTSGRFQVIPEEVGNYFRDVYDHTLRVVESVQGYRELLTSVLAANLTQVSVRQNEDMRKISAWAALIAVPTMISGVYGMNFRFMPELDSPFGYPIVLLVILVLEIVLYRYFRKTGWF